MMANIISNNIRIYTHTHSLPVPGYVFVKDVCSVTQETVQPQGSF